MADLGAVTVVVWGSQIQFIILEDPWPRLERPRGSHFMPSKCCLLPIGMTNPSFRHGMICVPDKDATYITKALSAWERRLGTLSVELRAILEGTYVISRSGNPFLPIFMRNHASLDEEALDALWPTIAKMLWKEIF